MDAFITIYFACPWRHGRLDLRNDGRGGGGGAHLRIIASVRRQAAGGATTAPPRFGAVHRSLQSLIDRVPMTFAPPPELLPPPLEITTTDVCLQKLVQLKTPAEFTLGY